MSEVNIQETDNPYAAPDIEQDVDEELVLAPQETYRVVAGKLYCRREVDLSDVCWLTGESPDPAGTHAYVRRLAPDYAEHVGTIVTGIFVAVIVNMNFGSTNANAIAMGGAMALVLLFRSLLWRVFVLPFRLQVGESALARRLRRNSVRMGWTWLVLVVCCVVLVFCYALPVSGSRGPLVVVAATVVGAFVAVGIVHFSVRQQDFRPAVRQINEDLFVVDKLSTPFLQALNNRSDTAL